MSFQDRAQHSIGQIDKEVRSACLPDEYLPTRRSKRCLLLYTSVWNGLTFIAAVEIPGLEQP